MLKLNEKDNPAQNTMDSKKNKIRNLIGSTIITFNKRVNKLNDEIKDMKKEFNEQMTVLQDLFVKAFNENPNNSGPVPLVKKTSTQFSVSPVKGRKNNSILGVSMKGKQSNNFSKSPIRTNETCKTTKVKTDQGKLIISNLSQSKATEGNFDKALNSKVNSTDTTPKRFISNKRMSTDSPVKKKEPIKNTRNSAAIVELNSDKHQIDARRFSITDILASGSNLLEEIKKNKGNKIFQIKNAKRRRPLRK